MPPRNSRLAADLGWNMKKPPTTSIMRRASVTMPMDVPRPLKSVRWTFFHVKSLASDEVFCAHSRAWCHNACRMVIKHFQNLHDLSVAAWQACRDCSLRAQKSVFCSFGMFVLSRQEWSPRRLQRRGAEGSVRFNSFKRSHSTMSGRSKLSESPRSARD